MLVLLAGLALGHGGTPTTSEIVVGEAGDLTLVTSHGMLAEDDGWQWICEEVVGESAFATGLVRPDGGWLLATTQGLLASDTGCAWDAIAGPSGRTLGLWADPVDAGVLWTADVDGLWRDDGSGFTAESAAGFTLRDAAPLSDGRFALLGFDGEVGVLDIGGTRHTLPGATGAMSIIHVDDADRVYVHLPSGSLSALVRVSDEVEVLLDDTELIADVATVDDRLYVVHYLLGTRGSADDGATFSEPVGKRLECLELIDGEVFGCPTDGEVALARAERPSPDPDSWTWTGVVRFDDAWPADCPAQSTFAATCSPLWDDVSTQFGITEPAAPASKGCGCANTGPLASGWWLALLLALAPRRMRTQHRH